VLFVSGLYASPVELKANEQQLAVMFQMCTEFCDSTFFNCILDAHCPKKFPLPIPKPCMDQLDECMDECDRLFQLFNIAK